MVRVGRPGEGVDPDWVDNNPVGAEVDLDREGDARKDWVAAEAGRH